MALTHAILVALSEQSGSGYELARRFDRSIGYFWSATHQQIYRTLRVMACRALFATGASASPRRTSCGGSTQTTSLGFGAGKVMIRQAC